MANPRNPQDDGQPKNPAAPTSPGTEIEQGKVEISKDDLEKVSGGGTPSKAIVVDY
jgi:hypothetical protein